jgi:hypothetical protein
MLGTHTLTVPHPCTTSLCIILMCPVLLYCALCGATNSCFDENGGIYSQVKLTPKICGLAQHFFNHSGNYDLLFVIFSTFLGESLVYTWSFLRN